MSSFRRNGSVSRAAEAASKNRLHMDRNPQHSRINDPSNPAGRRKEIDNVMKRARQASPGSWDRKLLEVEQKDPNRWRHTGYKQLYLDGSKSPSPRRSRSPVGPGRRSRSPIGLGRRSRSPMARRSPVRKSRSRSARRSPRREPRARRTPLRRGSPLRSPIRARRSPPRPRTPPPARRDTPPRRPAVRPLAARPLAPPQRPPEPPPRKSSPSGSSTGSCSDESCSVCSAKNKKINKPPGKPRSRSPSPVRVKAPRPPPPKPGARPPRPVAPGASVVQPTRELLKAREASKRSREEKVLEWQRSQLAVNRPPPGAAPIPIPPQRIKREGERRPKEPRREERGVSPAAIQAALNESESDDESDASSEPQPQRLTLSERFGKMAAWSADRSARLENMRITRRQAGPGGLHVRIEPGPGGEPSDPADPLDDLDPAPIGSYPEELLAVAPSGLPSWDDVTVRYDYYKKRGYLRGLTLGDYVKWEEWWYKYQEWLKRERAYERWAEAEVGTVRRERRRRGGRHRRS